MKYRRNIFDQLSMPLRNKLGNYYSELRRRDRALSDQYWLNQSRSFEDYCDRLGVLESYLLSSMQSKIAQNGKARILDVGAGKAEMLKDLHARFGHSVELEALGFSFPDFRHSFYAPHVGAIEIISLELECYDFIFSVRGGFAYTLNSFSAIEASLNALALEGLALIEDSRLLLAQEWFLSYLKSLDFEIEASRFEFGKTVANKFTKRSSAQLDLKAFNERYVRLLNENEKIFLKWGFDRLAQGSPLNELFQELYDHRHYSDLC